MILVDHQIHELCQAGLVSPYEPSLVNPASLDVRLGSTAIAETITYHKPKAKNGSLLGKLRCLFAKKIKVVKWRELSLEEYSEESPYWLKPKEFILLSTLEVVNIPENIVAEFRLTSSRAREGLNQCLAVYIDPGFHNSVVTLEVVNECRYTSVPIYPGKIIGQLFFQPCTEPERSYAVTGRYNNCLEVTASKG